MGDIKQLLGELETLASLPRDKVDIGRLTKVKELIGEVGGQEGLIRHFGASRLKLLTVPRRGNDVIILDLVFELDDGQFVIVEAKYGVSQAGRSIAKKTSLVSISKGVIQKTPLPLKGQLEQLDAAWIKERIGEIGQHDVDLSKALKKAFDSDRVQILETRTRVDMSHGKAPNVQTQLTDHTSAVRKEAKTGRRFVDHEHRFAVKEALGQQRIEKLAKEGKELASALERRRQAEKPVQTALNAAKRSLASLKQTPGKELTKAQVAARERWNKTIADLEKQIDPLKRATADAKQALAKNEQTVELTEKLKAYDTRAMKAEQKLKRLTMADKLNAGAASGKFSEEERRMLDRRLGPKPTPMPGAEAELETTLAREARSTSLAQKATGAPLVAEKQIAHNVERATVKAVVPSTAAKVLIHEGVEGVEVAGRFARFSQLAFKGTRLVARAGSFVFKVVNFADPIFTLMDVVAIVDALVDWLRREKIEDEKEWKRIAAYLFGPLKIVKSGTGVRYATTMGHQIDAHAPLRMSDPQYVSGNALYWTTRWADPSWPGFVYIQIDATLDRQESSDEEVRFYWDALPAISFTDKPPANYRKLIGGANWLGPQDENNRFTDGKGGVSAQPSREVVRYTYPQPYLTPFDFLIIQCRTLYSDLVDFVAKFDENFPIALELEGEDFATFREQALRSYPLSAPLNSREIHVCLINIDHFVKLLGMHATQPGDAARDTPIAHYNAGRNRRLRLLQVLTSPYKRPDRLDARYDQMRPFWEIVLRLGQIVSTRDPAVIANIEYMRDQADLIDTNAKRARKLCDQNATGFLFNYEGATKKSSG